MDTIEIVGGVHAGTKRLQLKSVLERYGEIDICHKDRAVNKQVEAETIRSLRLFFVVVALCCTVRDSGDRREDVEKGGITMYNNGVVSIAILYAFVHCKLLAC